MFGSLLIDSLVGNGKGRNAPAAGESGHAAEGDDAFHTALAEDAAAGTGAGTGPEAGATGAEPDAPGDIATISPAGAGEPAHRHGFSLSFDTTAQTPDGQAGGTVVGTAGPRGPETIVPLAVAAAPATTGTGAAPVATTPAPTPGPAAADPGMPVGAAPAAGGTGNATVQADASRQAAAATVPTEAAPATPSGPPSAPATGEAEAATAPAAAAGQAGHAGPDAAQRPAGTPPSAGPQVAAADPTAATGQPAGQSAGQSAARSEAPAQTAPQGRAAGPDRAAPSPDAARADTVRIAPEPPARDQGRPPAQADSAARSGTGPMAAQAPVPAEARAGQAAPTGPDLPRPDQPVAPRQTGETPARADAETPAATPRAAAGQPEAGATATPAVAAARGTAQAVTTPAGMPDAVPARPDPDAPARLEAAPAPATPPAGGPAAAAPATQPAAGQPAVAFAAATERQQAVQRGAERSSPRAERMEALSNPTSQGATATATAATATAQTVAPPAGMALAPAQPGMALAGERGQDRPVPGGDIAAESMPIGGSDRGGGAFTGIERAAQQVATGLAELPRGVGLQLAEAASRFPDRPVELTLSPEELGRVRMTLSTVDGALTLSLSAERPETLELLRRHIDELARDFRALGYADVSFSFEDRPTGRDPSAGDRAEPGEGDGTDPAGPDGSETPAANPVRLALAPGQGLDLRF